MWKVSLQLGKMERKEKIKQIKSGWRKMTLFAVLCSDIVSWSAGGKQSTKHWSPGRRSLLIVLKCIYRHCIIQTLKVVIIINHCAGASRVLWLHFCLTVCCLSHCLHAYTRNDIIPQIFCACRMWPWLGLPLWRCNTLCKSRFVDDQYVFILWAISFLKWVG